MKNILWGLQLRKYKKRAIARQHEADFYNLKRQQIASAEKKRKRGAK